MDTRVKHEYDIKEKLHEHDIKKEHEYDEEENLPEYDNKVGVILGHSFFIVILEHTFFYRHPRTHFFYNSHSRTCSENPLKASGYSG